MSRSRVATKANDKLLNACDGKTESQGGLNVPDFKEALLIKYPQVVDLVEKAVTRDDLCAIYKQIIQRIDEAQPHLKPDESQLKLKIFPVIPHIDHDLDKGYYLTDAYRFINWQETDITELNVNLYHQVLINQVNRRLLQESCEVGNDLYVIRNFTGRNYTDSDSVLDITTYFKFDKSDKDKRCKIFDDVNISFYDVHSRDAEALIGKNIDYGDFNTKPYAIILLSNGGTSWNEYLGHIYVWQSPVDPTIAVAIGIRGRVENTFIDKERRIQNISAYLLEGVRQFALKHKCTKIMIPKPLHTMSRILKSNGFTVNNTYPKEVIGISPAPYKNCNNYPFCYTRQSQAEIMPVSITNVEFVE